MKILKTFGENAKTTEACIRQLEARGATNPAKVDATVREILGAVRERGDAALREYAGRFDGLADDQSLLVSKQEMQHAWESTSEELRAAMRLAQANIRTFAERQLPHAWSFRPTEGMEVGQIVRPLGSVGCYVPGGRYPLPSTLLMTVTPAQVAGVERIVVCSPKPAQETLAAAYLCGVTEFCRVGGAQAIAALAYGTDSIAPVDKIVGPGNLYVTAAKAIVSAETGIDMPAGPTEIVVTSEAGDANGIAADLVAQAEHDPEALAIFITSKPDFAEEVVLEAKRLAEDNSIAHQSLSAHAVAFVTANAEEAHALTNRLAPEHLTVDTGAGTCAGSRTQAPSSSAITRRNPWGTTSPARIMCCRRDGNGRIRGGLSVFDLCKGHHCAAVHSRGTSRSWPPHHRTGGSRRPEGPCRKRPRENARSIVNSEW